MYVFRDIKIIGAWDKGLAGSYRINQLRVLTYTICVSKKKIIVVFKKKVE